LNRRPSHGQCHLIGKPAALPYDRRHDAPQPAAGDIAIISRCCDQICPALQAITGSIGSGGYPVFSSLPGITGHFLASAQSDWLRLVLFLRCHPEPCGDPRADRPYRATIGKRHNPQEQFGRGNAASLPD